MPTEGKIDQKIIDAVFYLGQVSGANKLMSATHGIVEEKAGPFSSSRDLQVHALLTLLAQQKIYRFFVEAMKERAKENGFDSIREIWKIVKPDATESELEGAELD